MVPTLAQNPRSAQHGQKWGRRSQNCTQIFCKSKIGFAHAPWPPLGQSYINSLRCSSAFRHHHANHCLPYSFLISTRNKEKDHVQSLKPRSVSEQSHFHHCSYHSIILGSTQKKPGPKQACIEWWACLQAAQTLRGISSLRCAWDQRHQPWWKAKRSWPSNPIGFNLHNLHSLNWTDWFSMVFSVFS